MVHEMDVKQRSMQKHIGDLDSQRLAERVRNLEIAEQRLTSANSNLSRQVNDADKLHTSLLQLLEDVEDIETKFDKTVPEIRREISKVEIDSAQLSSDQNILKEEDHNMVKTIQALAVSISTLQNEHSNIHSLESEINKLRLEVEMLKADKTSTHPSRSKFNEVSVRRRRKFSEKKKFILEILRDFRADNNKTLPSEDSFFLFFYVLINDLRYGKSRAEISRQTWALQR